jgi:hypothetical protein
VAVWSCTTSWTADRAAADGPWRTATVATATCADANAANTAAIVAGAREYATTAAYPDRARRRICDLNGWPLRRATVPVPTGSHVYAGAAMSAVLGFAGAVVRLAGRRRFLPAFQRGVVVGVAPGLRPEWLRLAVNGELHRTLALFLRRLLGRTSSPRS